MALNNRERITRAFDLLQEGLHDLVDEVMTRYFHTSDWPERMAAQDAQRYGRERRRLEKTDPQVQLRAITEYGREFSRELSRGQQSLASELRDTRNEWAHGAAFNSDDTSRALDTIERLLRAVNSMDSANDVRKLREDLQRTVYEDRTRKRSKPTNPASISASKGLKPWREIIHPHDDVARGDFTASEFAADLHDVSKGQASSEYGDPIEFFSRTYLTEGLRDLLTRALRRLSGDANASPVVNLQTNFGGGKTHSMLALYHLFSGTKKDDFPQEIQDLIQDAGNPRLDDLGVRRVTLVGTYLQAGSPSIKEDGTEVNTLWGELAWQLGGRDAYNIVAGADRSGTNPGEALHTLISAHGPVLILIDEWVAYARQLVTDKELPAGSFDTQFTFAQSLTETVRGIPGAMLVVSIPASDGGKDGRGTDIEVGGTNGQLALERLQNVIRRVADQWRPSSRDESFEIVRRRLFKEPDAQGLADIAVVARQFVTMYRNHASSFPRDVATTNDYEHRIRASYPLHPELLDRLYEDWSTLERFQRTRGVLKLVSSIVHELWVNNNDAAPLILPGNVPLSATRVNTDLTQYLEDQWKPIIDSDIDGVGSTAQRIDADRPTLGERSITQRIARTIFIGAAPRSKTSHKGLDKQYLWLGTAIPGDPLGNFGTAVEQISQRSTYFYEEQGLYWFDTQPSVAKAARDHAEQLREDLDTAWNEIVRRLKASEGKGRGFFSHIHIAPDTAADIPDMDTVRLVIVHPRLRRRKNDGAESEVVKWIRAAVESKGAAQRTHRNTLVFLVADSDELERLENTTRNYLGWKMVQDSADQLNLSKQQSNQADSWVKRLNDTINSNIRSTYMWMLYPEQVDPTRPFELVAEKTSDSDGKTLTERVFTKIKRDGQLITELAPTMLGMTLHSELGALWDRVDDMTVGELWGYFTQYAYMPRLASRTVLDDALRSVIDVMLMPGEQFALATGKDSGDSGQGLGGLGARSGLGIGAAGAAGEGAAHYQGLILPPSSAATAPVITDNTLVVKWEVAKAQADTEAAEAELAAQRAAAEQGSQAGGQGDQAVSWNASPAGEILTASYHGEPSTIGTRPSPDASVGSSGLSGGSTVVELPDTHYTGSVVINSDRYVRMVNNIIEEVIDRLAGSGADLEITMNIHATKPKGFTETEKRIISENSQTLKFGYYGFERG